MPPADGDEPGLPKDIQMPADGRLGDAKRLGDQGHADAKGDRIGGLLMPEIPCGSASKRRTAMRLSLAIALICISLSMGSSYRHFAK